MRRTALILAAVLLGGAGSALAGATPSPQAMKKVAPAKAAPAKAASAARPSNPSSKGSFQQCTGAGAARKCQRVAVFSGQNAPAAALRKDALPRPSGDIWLKAVNLNAELRVNIYKADGSYDEESLAMIDELFRCTATGEVRAVNAKLLEHLSRLSDHFTGKPVELVSGFRFAERNSSRHFHASAMDVRVPGVSAYELRKFAETLDQGKDGPDGGMGIGIYPASGFVHIDFRAPGEPSFRWVDWSGGKRRATVKKPTGRTQPARKPTS